MLSIIISSYQKKYYNQIVKNIGETIGDEFKYEIIQIWNPNLMGITKAYNRGAQKAKYDYFLFLHEDIIFHQKNWGEALIHHLSLPNTGVIGVAGSNYVPKAPSGWFVKDNSYLSVYIMGTPTETSTEVLLNNSCLYNRNPVYGLDGVFMAVTKEVFLEFGFNEYLSGFHSYDTDFSLRVATKYQNYVINDILIEHFSFGKPDKKWLENNIIIRKTIKHKYPQKNNSTIEKILYLSFINMYFEYYFLNLKGFIVILSFYPLWRLKPKDHVIVIKKLYPIFFIKKESIQIGIYQNQNYNINTKL